MPSQISVTCSGSGSDLPPGLLPAAAPATQLSGIAPLRGCPPPCRPRRQIIHRPIADYSLPAFADMARDVRDVLLRLAAGGSVLVHCAGGSGRTGMVAAAVARTAGIRDPITWVRR